MPIRLHTLPRVLLFDSATCAVMGLGLALAAEPLGTVFGLPPRLLRGAGVSLLPFAIALAMLARTARPPVAALHGVVAANLAWAVASVALPLLHVVAPTVLGTTFLVAQALAVAAIAIVEWTAVRRSAVLGEQPSLEMS